MTGGRLSLFHLTLLHNHSTASSTPVPVKALQGNTRLSLTLPPFSPSKTFLTKPSLILTTSTQSYLSFSLFFFFFFFFLFAALLVPFFFFSLLFAAFFSSFSFFCFLFLVVLG